DHLVNLGHRNIAHIAGPANISTAITRLRAYREALFEHNIEYDHALVRRVNQLRFSDAVTQAGELLDSSADFSAIVSFNDLVALGVYSAMDERSLRCPQDISVVGFGNTTPTEFISPRLTTTAIDYYEMGRQAASVMLDMIANDSNYQHQIGRASCRERVEITVVAV